MSGTFPITASVDITNLAPATTRGSSDNGGTFATALNRASSAAADDDVAEKADATRESAETARDDRDSSTRSSDNRSSESKPSDERSSGTRSSGTKGTDSGSSKTKELGHEPKAKKDDGADAAAGKTSTNQPATANATPNAKAIAAPVPVQTAMEVSGGSVAGSAVETGNAAQLNSGGAARAPGNTPAAGPLLTPAGAEPGSGTTEQAGAPTSTTGGDHPRGSGTLGGAGLGATSTAGNAAAGSTQPETQAPQTSAAAAPGASQLVQVIAQTAQDPAKATAAGSDVMKPDAIQTSTATEVSSASPLDILSSAQGPVGPAMSTGVADLEQMTTQPAEPFRQIVNVVQPLRQAADGEYQLTLQLHPEHMGRVEISVTMHNGQINMQLSSDNAASRQMLRDSLNDLRGSLQSSGIDTGALDVGTRDGRQQETFSGNGSRASGADREMEDDEFFTRLATAAANGSSSAHGVDGALDVRI